MHDIESKLNLILGSSSVFRKELLERLQIPFTTSSPEIDESRKENESPQDLVRRLALEKAKAVAARHPQALIIGSDQVAVIDNDILGKPNTREKARLQLDKASGRCVTFYTGLCLLDCRESREELQYQLDVVPYHVHFRKLTSTHINAYIDKEQPLNCAGSFKSEGLGVALFEKMQGDDPTALIGLPLIRLVVMLEQAGVDVLSY